MMSIENRRYIFIVATFIWVLQNFQVLGYPAASDIASHLGQTGQPKPKIVTTEDRISAFPRQENDEEPSDRPRLDDFIKGLNSILTGLLTLDIRNTVGGTFKFIPPSVRQGVESIVLAVIGKPQATTTVSSILFPETTTTINGTTVTNLGESENELEADEEREE